jgi:hypothetical protein
LEKECAVKILVCGGRTYGWLLSADSKKIRNMEEYDTFYGTLDQYLKAIPNSGYGLRLISGHALGADQLAEEWAFERQVPIYIFPAKWRLYPKAAGPIRNQQMLDEGQPELVIAFPGGKGTADMISRAEKAGIKVIKVEAINE